MTKVLYRIKNGEDEYLEEREPAANEFEFTCCEQSISFTFTFDNKDAWLTKTEKCCKCGKTFAVKVEGYVDYVI